MGADSAIQWTHHTFNPWRGCTHVSPGCEHCYAETLSKRNPAQLGTWGAGGTRVIAADAYWRQPERWNRKAELADERHRVFCASLADVFEDRPELVAPRRRLWELICATPHLDWLLLTKRPENINRLLGPRGINFYAVEGPVPCPQPNVWIGTTVEDQRRADERIPILLDTPAAVRFLSCEPLLYPINLHSRCRCGHHANFHHDGRCNSCPDCETFRPLGAGIDWLIVGGESGSKARPMHPGWAAQLVEQARLLDIAPFVKQLGAWRKCPAQHVRVKDARTMAVHPAGMTAMTTANPFNPWAVGHPYWSGMERVGGHGGDIDDFPHELRVREFPIPAVAA